MAVRIVSCTSDITPPVQKRAYQLKSVETRCWLDKCSREARLVHVCPGQNVEERAADTDVFIEGGGI
jgi:hypothetical protein